MDEGPGSLRPAPKGLLALGGAAGAVPFVISVASWNNGTYRDWIAIAGGAVAAVCGVVAVLLAVRAKSGAGFVAGAALIAALGGYQLARGFGAFEEKGHTETTIVRTIEPTPPPAPAHEAKPAAPPEDPIHARQRICDGGDATVCGDLGIAYLDGDGVAKDADRGRALVEKGCDLGGKLACKNLALIHREGAIVPKDLAKSFAYAVKACEQGQQPDIADAAAVGYSCDMAADMARAGKDSKRGAQLGSEAIAYYRTACDANAAHCMNLALSLQEGTNIKKDLAGARELFGKACDAGNVGGCNNLGDMMNHGQGGKTDKATAKKLFRQACDAKLDIACTNLKQMK